MRVLVHPAVSGWRKMVDRFKNLVETTLFLIPAFQRNCFNRVVCLEQPLRRAFETLANNIGVNGRMDQLVEAELQLFAIDIELPAETLDRVLLVKIVIEILADSFDQLCISSFHVGKSIRLVDRPGFGERLQG
jgi:hypothetical protein